MSGTTPPPGLTPTDKAALWIAGAAVGLRALMQFAPHAGDMPDYAWITNFAVIAAGWLSIRSKVGDQARLTGEIKDQTNGGLDKRIEEIVRRVLDDQTRAKGY